ncbi:MAG: penicillin-binding protein activator [Candidatus Polarisedimenticolaceae bacterium]|nr:penicillin-binding protein activator [Candidatus Polarisedimenticolaceae bacterium]
MTLFNSHPADSTRTMQVILHRLAFILVITPLLIIQGCSTTPESQLAQEAPISVPLSDIETAQLLMAEGEYQAAAKLYFQQAIKSEGDRREQLLLLTADAWMKSANSDQVTTTLAYITQRDLNPTLTLHYRLLLTEVSLQHGQIESALDLLEPPPTEDQPLELRQRYRTDKAEAFRLAGNILESARERDLLDRLLQDEAPRLENQRAIINTLITLTDTALELLQPDPPGRLGGWMELARAIKRGATTTDNFTTQIAIWHEAFPQHPATAALLESYQTRPQEPHQQINHIAVLLPSSGPYANVAGALRDGLLAAYFVQPADQRPRLQFYDSSDPDQIWPLYMEAVEKGAQIVLGPLHKNAVAQLAREATLAIPTLALNSFDDDSNPPENLFQYGLFPEDEARQVAERAWLDGHSRALVLAPDNNWGERITNSFTQRWQALGGTIAEQQHYPAKANDFGKPIKALLNIDQSHQRHRQLERLLGEKLKFEPRRRQDVDFIFLAARSQKGRQIRPQLQFHHAGSLPLYTTSHIYSGTTNRDKDKDLGRLLFPDIPWVLEEDDTGPLSRQHLSRELSTFQDRYARYYAMGIDSYSLLSQLERLRSSTDEILSGTTGRLYLDGPNQIHRQLVWAKMSNGKSRIVGYAPRIEPITPLPSETLPIEEVLPAEMFENAPTDKLPVAEAT